MLHRVPGSNATFGAVECRLANPEFIKIQSSNQNVRPCRSGKLLCCAPNPPVPPDVIAPQPVAVAAALAASQCIAFGLIASSTQFAAECTLGDGQQGAEGRQALLQPIIMH